MRRAAALCLLTFSLVGCAAGRDGVLATAHAERPGMSCAQATRVARGALLRMGYVVEEVRAATPAAPGEVIARKRSGWSPYSPEAGAEYTVRVRIRCSDRGAELEAETDEPLTARVGFRSGFAAAVETIAARRVERPRIAERPQTGLVITVEPQAIRPATDADATNGAGVRPLLIQIENRTQRTYGFLPDEVQLLTQEGKRISALTPAELGGPGDAPAGGAGERRLDAETDLAPGDTLTGHMYFPAAAYRRAKILLIDRETEEIEGFAIEF